MAVLWTWYLTGGATTLVLIELLALNRHRRLLLLDAQHCRVFVAHIKERCRLNEAAPR